MKERDRAKAFVSYGFTVAVQSCRGTAGSGGVFVPRVNEQRDCMDAHRWVRKQLWFTGKLVTLGESYVGFTQWAAAAALWRDDPANAPDAAVRGVVVAGGSP